MIGVALVLGAGIADLLPMVVVIVIILLSVAAQWISRLNQPQRPQGGGAAQPRRAQGDGLEDEIGEFLRRAAKRRGQPAGAPARAPPAPQEPVKAEAVREAPLGGKVTEHVQEYLNTGEFARRTSQLGEEVAQADAQVDEHLHTVFDHQVSALAGRPGESAAPSAVEGSPLPEDRVPLPLTTAGGLAALFGDVDNVRQAIILNEILQRPVERWT